MSATSTSYEDEVIFYWQNVGLEQFTIQAQAQGYEMSEDFAWSTLPELQRYIQNEQISEDATSEDGKWQFVACYYYLGEVINTRFGTDWMLIKDGSMHDHMHGIAKVMQAFPEMYLVPRELVIMVSDGLMEEGLQAYIENFASYDGKTPVDDIAEEV